MEKKPLSKTAKIALGVTVSAIAVTAIAVPTAITLSNNTAAPTSYSITISNNLSANDGYNIVVQKGTKFKDLTVEQKEGYVFGGWFKDMACTQKYNDDDFIDKNLTIFAKWEAKTLALSVDLPTGMSFRFLKTNGEQYTEEELSNIKYGTTMKFEISSDDQVEGTSYAYAVNYDGEEVPHTVVENKFIYFVTLTKEAPIVLDGRFEYAITTDENSNEQITIKNYKNYSESEKIIVPEKIANLPVAVIENLSGGDLSQENKLITSVSLPKTVKSFDAEYLGLLTNLAKLNISSQNPYLKCEQGVVYSEDNNQAIVLYCLKAIQANAIKLPLNTVEICANAFEDCTGVKSVNFEELTNLVSIGDYAFTNSGIETAHLGESVTDIGYSAFNACQNLKSVKVLASFVKLNAKSGNPELGGKFYYAEYSKYVDLTYTFANCPNIEYIYWNAGWDNKNGSEYGGRDGIYAFTTFTNSATNKGAAVVCGKDFYKVGLKHCTLNQLFSVGDGTYISLNNPLNNIALISEFPTEETENEKTVLVVMYSTLDGVSSLSNLFYSSGKNDFNTLFIELSYFEGIDDGPEILSSLKGILVNGNGNQHYQEVESGENGLLKFVKVEEGE